MTNLNPTHRGVLLPDEMIGASEADKNAYAAKVKAGNRAFCDAYFALEDAAAKLGLPDLDLDMASSAGRWDS
jgi:hypothetical protein